MFAREPERILRYNGKYDKKQEVFSMSYAPLQNGSDIRGVALEGVPGEDVTLTNRAVFDLCGAFARWLKKQLGKDRVKIALGHDSRLSADLLMKAAMDGLVFQGCDVLDCGLASTPSMFMACIFDEFDADGAIMITASHLPWNRNGLKFFDKGGGLDGHDIRKIIELADEPRQLGAPGGSVTKADLMSVYSRHLIHIIKEGVQAENYDKPLEDLHIVVDAGNGAGGFYATKVLEPLGANVTGSQFLDPDGHFPNHIPNPENKEAMASIARAVTDNEADLGIIFDTDVDRSAAVDENGRPIARNAIVALASAIAAEDHPGMTVVTDSVTSDELNEFLEEKGIHQLRFRRGYKNVIDKAKELNAQGVDAPLAIETSGHAAFRENHFLDDGAYLAARIIIQSAKSSISDLISDLGAPLEEKEVRYAVTSPEAGQDAIAALKAYANDREYIVPANENYEGIRLNFDADHGDGWLLLRGSLHDPVLVANFESNTEGGTSLMENELGAFLETLPGVEI